MKLYQMKYSYCIYILFIVITLTFGGQPTNNTLLLFSTTKVIRITSTSRNSNNKIVSTTLVQNFTEGPAIDYHYEKKKLCWTSHEQESILCDDFDGVATKNKVEVISTGVESAVGLACDWFTSKLYWTDSETKRIEVTSMESLHRKVLFWTDIDQPRAIALAPMKGWMFWTDWGEVQKIERAGMNGDPKTRKVIVNTNIIWPNGLTIDYESERIYWIDGKLHFIEVMTFEGTNRVTLLDSGFEYPFALTVFQTELFWTDWKTWSIHFFDVSTNVSKEFIHHQDAIPMYIQAYDKSRQPKQSHPCEKNNGGCSHLCLLAPTDPGYSCACPIGIKLVDNFTCASGPEQLLLLARRTDTILIHLDSPEYSHKTLPLNDIKYTIAVDFDPVERYIYWSDDEVKKIQRAQLNGSDQQDVVTSEIQHPDGIAVDWVGRNIYWTDAGTDRVEVCRLNEKYRRVIIFDDLLDPRAIAVAPELGWLFWSDWCDKNPKVERANLDGSERKTIVSGDLGWPNGITLDLQKQTLYWCDAKIDRIEYSDMDGNHRRALINDNLPHVFGFTLMGDFLYWTDWQRRTIERAHKDTGGSREVIVDQLANVMGLKAIKLENVSGSNLCSDNNGGCSQFCFYRHNKTKVCACELGYELASDRRTCVKPDIFMLYTKRNQIGMIGVENNDNGISIPVTGINNCSSVDYDINTMSIYWADSASRSIMRAFLNGSYPQKIVDLGLAAPEEIAIDWLGLNIYWTDPFAQRIEVARLPGSSRKTLLWEGKVSDPHSIVLDPPNGQMYWSEWGASKSIKKAAMDGSKIETLVHTTSYAIKLTLDYDNRRLYWIEINSAVIRSVDLNGNDAKIVIRDNIFKPVGLTLYKNFIYWSDNQTGEVVKASISDGSNRQVVHKNAYNITDLQFYHSEYHGSNQCAVSNGGCKHLCLALPAVLPEKGAKYVCACPTHYSLENNDCIPPKRFMIYSQKNLTVRLLPSPAGCLEAALPIQGLKWVKAIDFDPLQRDLYWIEGKMHLIKRASVTGTNISTVVDGNKELQPYDLAIDSLGRLLFWTSSQDVINVTRLDNGPPLGVVVQRNDEKPRLLAIHSTKRLLFYTDIGPARQLVRTRLDGSHRLVITKDADIAAIAVDQENDCIVWSKGQSIHMSNIEGENQVVLVNDTATKATQLTILSGWLYWIDREFQLQRVELHSGNLSSPLSLQTSHIVDLIAVTEPDQNHPCFRHKSKKCTNLCIMNGTNQVCACPRGQVLKEDKRSCSAVQKCGPDQFTCVSVPDENCIPILWRCDREKDCPDGSDELNCPDCLKDQFKCKDGKCINLNHVCDGYAHCSDHSDEERCCTDGFRCPDTEVCLPSNLVCNKIDNCPDGSDEHPSYCNNPRNLKGTSKLKGSSSGLLWAILGVFFILLLFGTLIYYYFRRSKANEDFNDQSEDSLSPMQPKPHIKMRKGIPDVVRMSMVTGSETSYDRNHITGASSSTNESNLTCYPREPLNPPPSPATTRGSSPSSRYRPYRHYRSINQPPPPTPCSTDVCDESDCNYPTRSRYDGGPFPPPPTPRSQCHSESCPPSPSSRSSTYFNPFPPPPSPVASPPRGYDS